MRFSLGRLLQFLVFHLFFSFYRFNFVGYACFVALLYNSQSLLFSDGIFFLFRFVTNLSSNILAWEVLGCGKLRAV